MTLKTIERERERERERRKKYRLIKNEKTLLIRMWERGIPHYYHFVKNVSPWGATCDIGAVVEGWPMTSQESPHSDTRLLAAPQKNINVILERFNNS